MDQLAVIESLFRWLQANQWSDSLAVKCDHVTEAREELALFVGSKVAGEGRGSRVAQVDILVCNEATRTVDLIVEVDTNPNPKTLMGDILAVLLADNYTPSNSFSSYAIRGTLFIFVTVLHGRPGSQKGTQFKLVEEALRSKFDLPRLGVRDVRLCFGTDELAAIERAKEIVLRSFLTGRVQVGAGVGEEWDSNSEHLKPSSTPPPEPRFAANTRAAANYRLRSDFDRNELTRLLSAFQRVVKRHQDVSVANRLEKELLKSDTPKIEQGTLEQLAKWCKTGGIYSDGMHVAREISRLLFGCILDRDMLRV